MKTHSSRKGSAIKSSPKTSGNSLDKDTGQQADTSTANQEPVASAAPGPGPASTREENIAIIAYYKAERRGFATSGELDDWLEAEKEVDRQNAGAGKGGSRSGT